MFYKGIMVFNNVLECLASHATDHLRDWDNAAGIGDNSAEIGDDTAPLWKKHSLQANMFHCY